MFFSSSEILSFGFLLILTMFDSTCSYRLTFKLWYCFTGTNFLRAQLTDLSGDLPRRRLFRCSYAFIQESGIVNQSGFLYNLDFFQNNSMVFPNDEFRITTTPPVVHLDWRIGTYNCSQHLNDPLYACRSKRGVCFDNLYDNIGGYRCSCADGYEGNPYLPDGCQG